MSGVKVVGPFTQAGAEALKKQIEAAMAKANQPSVRVRVKGRAS